MITNTQQETFDIDPRTLSIFKLMRFAESGLFWAELNDGSIVDLRDYIKTGSRSLTLSGFDLGDLFSGVKNIFKKPLKALANPTNIAMAAGIGVFGPVGVAAAQILNQSGALEAIESGDWKEVQRRIRGFVQGTGAIPSNAQIAEIEAYYKQLQQEMMLQAAGLPWSQTTFSKYQDWLIPAAIAGGVFLLISLIPKGRKRKEDDI